MGATVPTVPRNPPAPTVRGACPGVGAPLEATDGMLLRVRLPGGRITASGLRGLAEVAERWGSSVVELTARANVQLRGVAAADVPAAAATLVAARLADPDPARDERRDVIAGPLAGHDPAELLDLSATLGAVVRLLTRLDGLDGLPPKFGVVLDGGGRLGVREVPGDLALGAVRTDDHRIAVQVEIGRSLDDGAASVTCVDPAAVEALVTDAARLAAATGERLSARVERLGRAAVEHELLHDHATRRAAAPAPRPTGGPGPIIGRLGHPTLGLLSLGAAPWLGRTGPEALRVLASVAEASGAVVRLTPWRSVVLAGLPVGRVVWAGDVLGAAGLSVDPADPGHLLSACVGRAGCASSRADTAAAARDLLVGPTTPRRLHLAGCEKGCGAGSVEVLVADDHGRFPIGAP